MRLLFVNRFYQPETPATGQLLTDLAEALAAAGHEVTVITSHSGGEDLPARETHAGVHIRRVRSTRSQGASMGGKAWDFATFFLGALGRLWLESRRDSIVIALTDPPLLGIGAWLVARTRGARMVHWVQDIYPEIAIALAGQRWLRLLRPLRNLAWRRADFCVALGTDMGAILAGARVPTENIVIVPNWAPARLAPDTSASTGLRAAWGLDEKFVVAYSGNLGRVHDLDTVLAAADTLRDDPDIRFVFVGGGPQRAALETTAAKRGLTRVRFVVAQPREQLAAALGVGDLHLVTLKPGCEHLVFPSKIYGVAAVHRPLLFIGPPNCEIARLVVDQGLGHAVAPDDIAGIVAVIRRFAGDPAERRRCAENAARFAATNDASVGIARWSALLELL